MNKLFLLVSFSMSSLYIMPMPRSTTPKEPIGVGLIGYGCWNLPYNDKLKKINGDFKKGCELVCPGWKGQTACYNGTVYCLNCVNPYGSAKTGLAQPQEWRNLPICPAGSALGNIDWEKQGGLSCVVRGVPNDKCPLDPNLKYNRYGVCSVMPSCAHGKFNKEKGTCE